MGWMFVQFQFKIRKSVHSKGFNKSLGTFLIDFHAETGDFMPLLSYSAHKMGLSSTQI